MMKLTVITRRTADADLAEMTRGKFGVPRELVAFRAAVVDGPEWARITAYASTRDAAARQAYEALSFAHPEVEFSFSRRDAGVVVPV